MGSLPGCRGDLSSAYRVEMGSAEVLQSMYDTVVKPCLGRHNEYAEPTKPRGVCDTLSRSTRDDLFRDVPELSASSPVVILTTRRRWHQLFLPPRRPTPRRSPVTSAARWPRADARYAAGEGTAMPSIRLGPYMLCRLTPGMYALPNNDMNYGSLSDTALHDGVCHQDKPTAYSRGSCE